LDLNNDIYIIFPLWTVKIIMIYNTVFNTSVHIFLDVVPTLTVFHQQSSHCNISDETYFLSLGFRTEEFR